MFYLEMRIRRASLEDLIEEVRLLRLKEPYLKKRLSPYGYCTYSEYCNRVDNAIKVRNERNKRTKGNGIQTE